MFAKIWLKIKKLFDPIKLYFDYATLFFRNHHKIFLVFSIFFLIAGGILLPKISFGQEELVGKVVSIVLGLILHVMLLFFLVLLTLAGWILDFVVGKALNVHTTDAVNTGWALSRDVANMFFIIFLLIIAFATILRIEAYQYKALLPKLILAVLLVNFSRTICTVFIEFSNVLTGFFLNIDNRRESANAIVGIMGFDSIWQVDEDYDLIITQYEIVLSLALIVMLMGALAIALGGLAGMLVVRTIALMVLIVISPLAFVMNVLPATKSYFTKWWEKFLEYIWYAPLAAFFLYLALLTAVQGRDALKKGQGNLPGTGQIMAIQTQDSVTEIKTNMLPTEASSADYIYVFGLVFGLLFASILMIKTGGGMLAGMMMKGAKLGMLGAGSIAAGFAGKRLSRALARSGTGRISRGLTKVANRINPKLGQAVQTGFKGLRFLSPTVTKQAWSARQAELDRRSYGESIGWAHNVMNRAFMDKDKTNYERLHQGHEVGEQMKKLKDANPSDAHPFYRDQFYRAIKAGDMNRAEASFRLLAQKNNDNEITRDIGMDRTGALGKLLHSSSFVAAGRANEQSDEAIADMLYHVFGKERGQQVLMDMGEHGKSRGNWQYVEAVKYDKAKGEFVDNPERAEYAAAEYSKMSSDDKARQSRFTFTNMEYDDKGEEKITGITGNFKVVLEKHGYTDTDAERAPRFVSAVTQKAMLAPAALEQIKNIIKKQLASTDAAENDRGRRNAQWVMAATSGTRVTLATPQAAASRFKDYYEKKMKEQKVTGSSAYY